MKSGGVKYVEFSVAWIGRRSPLLDNIGQKQPVRFRAQLCRLAEPNEWQVSGGEGSTPNGDNEGDACRCRI